MTDAAMAVPSRRAEMWYAGVAPQGRLSVAFRVLLAIPHYVVLFFLNLAMLVVALIGWFGALFMGRLPGWAHTYISGVTRWDVRVNAYLFLLTDRYPPFSFDDADYPARPFPPPEDGRLNRLAVFFRFILVIPANVFANIVDYGLTVPLLIVTWFIVLIRGEMPPTLYECYSALVRFHLRVESYFFLLTSEYPWGMLGDREAPAPAPAPPAAPSYPPPTPPAATPPSDTPGPIPPPPQPYSYPPGPPGQGATGPAPMPPTPPPGGFGATPRPPIPSWQRGAPAPGRDLPQWATLVLTSAARGLMIFAIVWGSIVYVGQSAVQNAFSNNNTNNNMMFLRGPAAHDDTFV